MSDIAVQAIWTPLAPLPDKLGFAGGYAGLTDHALVFAGGANFPEKPPWEGGKKVWHDTIYSLQSLKGNWALIGRLPRPMAYGISLAYKNSVIFIGGGDADRHFAEVYKIEDSYIGVKIRSLPSLPTTLAFGCGAIVGDQVYVAGGQETPTSTAALHCVFRLDLANEKAIWEEVEPWPGPARILAVAGSDGESFYLFTGAELTPDAAGKAQRRYLTDAYRFVPKKGWERLADLPRAALGAPSPAAFEDGLLAIFSGDDGKQAKTPIQEHRGFPDSSLEYAISGNHWKTRTLPCPARVTTPFVQRDGAWIIPSGEVRPGVRSPEISSLDSQATLVSRQLIRMFGSPVRDFLSNTKQSASRPLTAPSLNPREAHLSPR